MGSVNVFWSGIESESEMVIVSLSVSAAGNDSSFCRRRCLLCCSVVLGAPRVCMWARHRLGCGSVCVAESRHRMCPRCLGAAWARSCVCRSWWRFGWMFVRREAQD
jgi:hypothetical protein